MSDDASRRSEADESSDGDSRADTHDPSQWDETLLGGATDNDDRDGGDADDGDGVDDGDSTGNVAGDFRPSAAIEPGSPDLGNALFVIFGAYLAVLGLTRLFVDLQGFSSRDVLVLTAGTLLVSLVVMGFLGLLTPDT